ncbi:MAG: adenylosuccinate lyase [Nitrospira bacterium SG8_3]|jgi:adenylosuccinate lyase|nr:MAG: adenylosuccinate lyase [Nitrospira bacterium SG8_3]
MIKRYTRDAMGRIWKEENKFHTWLLVEILACEGLAKIGQIPKKAAQNIRKKARFSIERIEAIEAETKHDVIAFLTNVAETVGPDARYIHLGMTSSDILDTAMAVRLKQASKIILRGCDRLLAALKKKALIHKRTVMVGRSHGIHAEPMTFGLKLALWFDEMRRNRLRMEHAVETISVGKLSGAVGTYANISPQVEAYVCRKLGLKVAPVSNQIIQRDRYAEYFAALAIVASTIEKIAVEIRHLQRTEVLEVEEYFSRGQKGSSAMPHKRNPVASENLSGLARLVRSNASAAFNNVALWHERDISHSSVERVIIPDTTIIIDYMLNRMTDIIRHLVVYPKRMQQNLELTRGLIFSQQVLLALARQGVSREEAYQMVQKQAMRAWKEHNDFRELVRSDPDIARYLGSEEIEGLFDVDSQLRHVDTIFARVFERTKENRKLKAQR